jgi:hypothetical protein
VDHVGGALNDLVKGARDEEVGLVEGEAVSGTGEGSEELFLFYLREISIIN